MAVTHHAFEQNVIAMVWDFDKTLINGYMQQPLFTHFGVDGDVFWREVNGLKAFYANQGLLINQDTIYLNHILSYVQQGLFPNLNNELLVELGSNLEFYPGLPDFFPQVQSLVQGTPRYKEFNITVEHYIVSTGFAAMIRGSAIAQHADSIWGCEFIDAPAIPGYLQQAQSSAIAPGCIQQIGSALDNTSKTRFLFEINKGANKRPNIDVNSRMHEKDRRVPFANMLYIADGPSDVPAFSILNQNGGATYAIYPPHNREAFLQVEQLRADHRIQMYGEANYSQGSQTYLWLTEKVFQIADRIVQAREEGIQSSVSAPPKHLT